MKRPGLPFRLTFAVLVGLASAASAEPQRVNLARFQAVQASSSAAGDPAVHATDGVVGNANRWKSDGPAPQWLAVTLPLSMELGSAQLYLGRDDIEPVASFTLQSWNGSAWVNIPGAAVSGNTSNVLNFVFASTVTTSRVRFHSLEAVVRVRELALFPPHGPEGYPIGTDVTLDLARKRPAAASSVDAANYAKGAVDGYVDDAARWKSADVNGPHTLEVDLQVGSRVGSVHLYSGSATSPPISAFTLDSWNGSAWTAIPGGTVSGNLEPALRLSFTPPVDTSRIRLRIPGNGSQRVRELAVFAAGAVHPLGTDVVVGPPPTSWFDRFGDGFWKIVNRANPHSLIVGPAGAGQTLPESSEEEKQFEVLYNLESDTYRLRNRDRLLTIGARGAGQAPGTAVVEITDFQGMPHELWRFEDVGGGDFRIINVWSGLALETDAGSPAVVTLEPPASTPLQSWRFEYATHYPKKGTGGYEGDWAKFGASWSYNWGRDTGASLPPQVVFTPMQHNRWWPDWSTLPEYYSGWHTTSRPVAILGFNEPDHTDQANMTVADAIALWPLLEAADLPLVSPVAANAYGGWLGDFYGQAGSRGYRVDFTAVHWYANPDAGSLIGHLESVYRTWGRPVWLTEFACVDWGGGARWTEEDNYRFIGEFMWRAEDLIWLKRYAIFSMSGDPPANPWDRVGLRSDVFLADGRTFTPFGELYASWDGDRSLRDRRAYVIHGLASSHRLRSSSTSGAPAKGSIRLSDVSVQWALVPAPAAGRWYVVSLRDGRRLRFSGTVIDLAPPGTAGRLVEWSFNGPDGSGYTFIDHPATSRSLRFRRTNDGNGAPTALDLGMDPFGSVSDSTRWRFIKPYQGADVAPPPAPRSLAAVAGVDQVTLSWPAAAAPDLLGYSVHRGASPGGPYTRIAAGLTEPTYRDSNVTAGVTYRYVVTAIDWIENESAASPEAAAAPLPAVDFRRGDADGSGGLDLGDPSFLLGYLFLDGEAPACLEAGDANDDGFLDIADGIYSIFFQFLAGAAPRSPFPECGIDPSGDGLTCDSFPACP